MVEASNALFYAFVLMWASSIFTIQSFCAILHSLLTKRRVRISFKLLIDFVSLGVNVWCAIIYSNWSQIQNTINTIQTHKMNFFMHANARDNKLDGYEKFYFTVLMGVVTILMWLRLYL